LAIHLSVDQRKELLEALAALPVDADLSDSRQLLRTFLPGPQYTKALDQRILVVRGERGAGKTTLFRLMRAAQELGVPLSALIDGAPDGDRIEGFSEQGQSHPAAGAITAFAASAAKEDLRALWLGHLCGRLGSQSAEPGEPDFFRHYRTAPTEPGSWVPAARQAGPALYGWLDARERAEGRTQFVIYDHLDRIGTTDSAVREKVSSSLLDLWLSLSQRYQRIRGKVFLREDLFQSTLRAFADATKLAARSVVLEWSAGSLYALLVRQMGGDTPLRTWLKEAARIELRQHRQLGWLPEPELDEATQEQFARALLGRYMGAGANKGVTYRWMINHLKDAHGRVTPRSLLRLVSSAAHDALPNPKATHRRLLTHVDVQRSLEKASELRAAEVQEDFPVVQRLGQLRGKVLFLPKRDVIKALGAAHVDDGYDEKAGEAFEVLLQIGVLIVRKSGEIDVPDIYRYGFGIKRRGGVSQR
jgi:hypothetical protein